MNALSQSELEVRERRIDEAPTNNFANLISIAGLDPKKHLSFADWSAVDFGWCDLRGYDFTGARLISCNFRGARIEGARFHQALIDEVRPGAKLDPCRTDLRAAKDWEAYVKSWKRVETPAPEHLSPGSVFQDAPFAPEMVVVPPGRFMMGSDNNEGDQNERPQHEVTIPQAFAVARFPVTSNEWQAASAEGVKQRRSYSWGSGLQPVVGVSWYEAKTYVSWLTSKTGKPYRLLSEAEWEYACRAGTESAYSFGETISKAQARFSVGNDAGATFEVGHFPANGFGLHDMHGNVLEWCEDCSNESYGDKPEFLKQTGGAWTNVDRSRRVVRGGSWLHQAHDLRSAYRERYSPNNRNTFTGFRVARALFTS